MNVLVCGSRLVYTLYLVPKVLTVKKKKRGSSSRPPSSQVMSPPTVYASERGAACHKTLIRGCSSHKKAWCMLFIFHYVLGGDSMTRQAAVGVRCTSPAAEIRTLSRTLRCKKYTAFGIEYVVYYSLPILCCIYILCSVYDDSRYFCCSIGRQVRNGA